MFGDDEDIRSDRDLADDYRRGMEAQDRQITELVAENERLRKSLRDYFAASRVSINHFLPEDDQDTHERFIGRPMPPDDDLDARVRWCADVVAKVRYIYADAMLAARERKPEPGELDLGEAAEVCDE